MVGRGPEEGKPRRARYHLYPNPVLVVTDLRPAKSLEVGLHRKVWKRQEGRESREGRSA
jgi:hypothetical protein